MTGNTVMLGPALAMGQLSQAALLTPIPLFVLGIMLGVATIRMLGAARLRSPLALIMGAEAVLLSVYVGYATAQTHRATIATHSWWQAMLLIALPTMALGCQTALLQKVRGRRVRTTYITGMLSDMTEDIVDLALWLWSRTHRRSWRRHQLAVRVLLRQAAWVRSLLLAGIWLCFFGGALSGAYAERLLLATSLVAPIVAQLILSVVEWVDPTVSARRLASGPS
jgi:uncharacterized membrane protein YoaK (UPF0700 family)